MKFSLRPLPQTRERTLTASPGRMRTPGQKFVIIAAHPRLSALLGTMEAPDTNKKILSLRKQYEENHFRFRCIGPAGVAGSGSRQGRGSGGESGNRHQGDH